MLAFHLERWLSRSSVSQMIFQRYVENINSKMLVFLTLPTINTKLPNLLQLVDRVTTVLE